MPTTPRLPLKLHEKLGDEAMTELVTLFGDLGADNRAAFLEVRGSFSRLEGRMDDLDERLSEIHTELKAEIAGVRTELKAEIAGVRTELKAEIADVRTALKAEIAGVITELKPQISAVQAELIKWTFLFWIGTIGLVLLLLRFPG
jgi:multidrug efflux pump subunit AcrA (membrane-fusion protein)